jgi:hypothetical protein
VTSVRKDRADADTPCRLSTPWRAAKSELIRATTTNGKKESSVFGSGLEKKRGRITRRSRIINGYIEKGRTNVPPPIFPGKYGKLVIGSVIKKIIQQIFEILPTNFFLSIDCQR